MGEGTGVLQKVRRLSRFVVGKRVGMDEGDEAMMRIAVEMGCV